MEYKALYDQAIGLGKAAIAGGKAAQSVQERQSAWDRLGAAIAQLRQIPKDAETFDQAQKALEAYQIVLDALDIQLTEQKITQKEYDQATALGKAAIADGKTAQSLQELLSARKRLADAIPQLKAIPEDADTAGLAQADLETYQIVLDGMDTQLTQKQAVQEQYDRVFVLGEAAIADGKVAVQKLQSVRQRLGSAIDQLKVVPKEAEGFTPAQGALEIYQIALDALDAQLTQEKTVQKRLTEQCDQAIALGKAAIADGEATQSLQELQSARKRLADAIAQLKATPKDADTSGLAQTALEIYQIALDILEAKLKQELTRQKRFAEQYDQAIALGKAAITDRKAAQSMRKQLWHAIAQLKAIPKDADISGLAQAALEIYQIALDVLVNAQRMQKQTAQKQHDQVITLGKAVIADSKAAVRELQSVRQRLASTIDQLKVIPKDVESFTSAQAALGTYQIVLDALDDQLTQEEAAQKRLAEQCDRAIALGKAAIADGEATQSLQELESAQKRLADAIGQLKAIPKDADASGLAETALEIYQIALVALDDKLTQEETAQKRLPEQYDQAIASGKAAIADGKAAQSLQELLSAQKRLADAIAQLKAIPKHIESSGLAQIVLDIYQIELDALGRQIMAKEQELMAKEQEHRRKFGDWRRSSSGYNMSSS